MQENWETTLGLHQLDQSLRQGEYEFEGLCGASRDSYPRLRQQFNYELQRLFRCNRPFWDRKRALLDCCQEDDHEQGHQYINY
jgi:hypothetical protein